MNVLFVHVPKTAGLSIEKSLGLTVARTTGKFKRHFKNNGHYSLGHIDVRKRIKNGAISKRFYDSAFKFCFCRNPFDRAVSHYFYARKKHPDILDPSVSFIDWTRRLKGYGKHFQCQSWYVDGIDFDFIGRFENLEKDFEFVKSATGLNGSLIKTNSTRHGFYWDYYNKESEENVAEFYKKDFKRFGYDNRLFSIL